MSTQTQTWDTDRVLTLPNILSLIRLLGVPLFLWLVLGPHADLAAVMVLALAGLTDFLDGRLARRLHQVSRLGQMLDPIADRLYIAATVLGLALRSLLPWWLVVVLALRDVMLAGLVPVLRTRGFTSLPVHFVGKLATFCLLLALPLILLGADPARPGAVGARVAGWALGLWGSGLYWWAGLLYLAQTRALVRASARVEAADRPRWNRVAR